VLKLFAGVTILLSLTVFLNMVAETMPATSDAVPLLGKSIRYFCNVLIVVMFDVLPNSTTSKLDNPSIYIYKCYSDALDTVMYYIIVTNATWLLTGL